MDIDSEGTGKASNVDLESALLQQFSCMGTSDKDELVQELQKYLGSQVSYSKAAFFLDMNNWNLQGAICSYLDVESPTHELPSMVVMPRYKQDDMEHTYINKRFKVDWHVCNTGAKQWPDGCYAKWSDGVNLGEDLVSVPSLQPNQSYDIEIELVAPGTPGLYESKWRLCTPTGTYFGEPMWAIVQVMEPTEALSEQLSHFNLSESRDDSPENKFMA